MNPAALPVPPAVAERARLLLSGDLEPVAARPASTVVLLRDGALGLEVYVLRRRTTMAFAGGMYAFPGGRVDPADDGSFETAAIRELFEETSVLLAGATPRDIVADTTDLEAERDAIVGRSLSFPEFLRERGLVARDDLLALCGHWVTPEAEVRRFDTRFFVAALPAGQSTRDVSGEADRVAWVRPVDVEAQVHAGEMALLPPTAATIAALMPFGSVSEALATMRTWDVPRIAPSVGFDEETGEALWQLST